MKRAASGIDRELAAYDRVRVAFGETRPLRL